MKIKSMNDGQKNILKKISKYSKDRGLYHISHNDLDGYGCSTLIKGYFCDIEIIQGNTNYGDIIKDIKSLSIPKDSLILITDLNLDFEEAEFLNNITSNWLVIDHHNKGALIQEKYPDNYYLDINFSATYLVNSLFFERESKELNELTDIIDAWDLHKKESIETFNKGAALNIMLKNTQKFYQKDLIATYNNYLISIIGLNIIEFGIKETEIKFPILFNNYLEFFNSNNKYEFLDEDISVDIKCAYLHLDYLDEFITYEDNNIIIYEGISTKITQYTSDYLFKLNNQNNIKSKVIINLNEKFGTIALRSSNLDSEKINAQYIAEKIKNGNRFGGGHPCASGAKIDLSKIAKDEIGQIGQATKLLLENLKENNYND